MLQLPRRILRARPRPVAAWLLLFALGMPGAPARAFLDIEEHGPTLRAGEFNLRVTNAGVVGNPFTDRSFDASFEFPKGSGHEFMRSAALWVGALDEFGTPHVSGGPMLEWRPTPAADDTVREAWVGRPGSRRLVDDDGDGSVDEDVLNGKDDDGDGEVDEDFGMVGQQMLAADYADDRPGTIGFQSYERHVPLGLSVHQEAYAWSTTGYRGIAGLSYMIRNHGAKPLHDLWVGLFIDWDVHQMGDPSADPIDELTRAEIRAAISKGTSVVEYQGDFSVKSCFRRIRRSLPLVRDRSTGIHSPMVGVMPLGHKQDPIGYLYPPAARAPGPDAFRVTALSADRSKEGGGIPRDDEERYAALSGQWGTSPDDWRGDQAMLVSCGPFAVLDPGDSIRFDVALVVADGIDELKSAMARAAVVYEGVEINRIPDDPSMSFENGTSGMNGHESCVEAPDGFTFEADKDCSRQYDPENGGGLKTLYVPGHCIWTDADCDQCTGFNGNETIVRWRDPALMPPAPATRVTAGDHSVRVEWDNLPEILLSTGQVGPAGGSFIGYHVYRLSDWRDRRSLVPPERWELVGAFGSDAANAMQPIATVTDTTLDYDRIWYEQKHYPVGRYALTDADVLDGFDYFYAVTTVVETKRVVDGFTNIEQVESPIIGDFEVRVTPRSEAHGDAGGVWVVPNPYRQSSAWERPAVDGDRLTRHIDFMGLPRASCTIRIWTVAGDLVAELHHDGSQGDGEASWNLVSRNGQDVVSGIYVYTVQSSLGDARGRFVVIR